MDSEGSGRDVLQTEVLLERGWKHEGDLYNWENNHSGNDDLLKIITRKHPTTKLPRRAFYVAVNDMEVRKLT